MKNLIIALAILVSVGTAKGQALYESLLLLNSATCSTADTLIPHDTLLEGFGILTTGYENTWNNGGVGTSVTFDPYADTTSLTSGKAAGQCNSAMLLTVNAPDGNEQSKYFDHGTIDVDTQVVDYSFRLYVTVIPDGAEIVYLFAANNNVSPNNAGDAAVRIGITTNGANVMIRARGTTDSALIPANINTWNLVEVHLDTTAANSTLTVNGGTPETFTRTTAIDPRYSHIGSYGAQAAGASITAYIDSITANTP